MIAEFTHTAMTLTGLPVQLTEKKQLTTTYQYLQWLQFQQLEQEITTTKQIWYKRRSEMRNRSFYLAGLKFPKAQCRDSSYKRRIRCICCKDRHG